MNKVAFGVAKAHIFPLGASFELTEVSANNYFAVITHPNLSSNIEEHINLNGLSIELAADYIDRKSTRLNSSHVSESRMPSSA